MAITVTEEFLPDAGVVEGQDWKRSSDLSLLALYNVTAVLFLGSASRLPSESSGEFLPKINVFFFF